LRDPCGVQHILQAELFVLGFLVGAQRLADRIDQLADRVLDDLELADLVLGIDQKIADGFILMAKLASRPERTDPGRARCRFSRPPPSQVRGCGAGAGFSTGDTVLRPRKVTSLVIEVVSLRRCARRRRRSNHCLVNGGLTFVWGG
jgi:hypothetical protein